MEFRSFLIKYGEIGVKGKNRWKFEDVLIRQVKTALRKVDGTFDISSASTAGSMWTRTAARIMKTRSKL